MKLFLLIVSIFLSSLSFAQSGANFDKFWSDGKAEVSSYSVNTPRYGEMRKGYDVLIYVTEDFLTEKQVKPDIVPNRHNSTKVLKLNHVRKFQTGIYDYSLMSSIFSPISYWKFGKKTMKPILPIKVSYSSSEWCGNYYEQLNLSESSYEQVIHSYFEKEADKKNSFDLKNNSILESNLLIRTRELNASFSSGEYMMLSDPMYSRMNSSKVFWDKAQVVRKMLDEDIETKIGSRPAILYTILSTERVHSIWVEASGEKRILKWNVKYQNSLNETAEILSSKRVPYWSLKNEKGKITRTELNIPPLMH